jgi:hypothetical protein
LYQKASVFCRFFEEILKTSLTRRLFAKKESSDRDPEKITGKIKDQGIDDTRAPAFRKKN